MKEYIQLLLLSGFGLACLLIALTYPMGRFESFSLWMIYMCTVGVYVNYNRRHDVFWH
ncbi:MAG: hypothetical protein H6Q84_121 [Deltaproteobacteria bacterium]|nr:hypothetical protein [Deltaproteobacteria bacterium]